MLFRDRALEGIKTGKITLVFRRWRRAPPAEGSTLRTAIGVLAFTRVQITSAASIANADAKAAGFASRANLLASLASAGTIYRMTVRLVGADPRSTLRNRRLENPVEAEAVTTRLMVLDRRARHPWVQPLLDIVATHPGVAAARLADTIGMDRVDLKRRMRRLKELGLTESLQTGYRLSPRGRDVLARIERQPR